MRLLLDLVIVLGAARAAAEIAEAFRLPAVPFEILAGVAVGSSALGIVRAGTTLRDIGALGAIVLLFEVGLEMDVVDLVRARWACARVAVLGVGASVGFGFIAARAAGVHASAAGFLGAAIAATSVGVSARVFRDLGATDTREARAVLGAGVIDDVVGLVILSAALGGTAAHARATWVVVAIAVAFLIGTVVVGTLIVPRAFDALRARSRVRRSLLVPALVLALGLARAAQAAGLAAIVGAFVAGLILVRSAAREDIARAVVPVGEVLTPVFFVLIGVDARLGAFAHGRALVLAGALVLAAIAGKLVAGAGAARDTDRFAVAAGMMPRGEVTLIFATAGLAAGRIGRAEFGALVAVVLVTAIVSPMLLRGRLHRA